MSDPQAKLKPENLKPADVINLDAYPISDPGTPAYDALVSKLRAELDSQQYVVLPNFIRPEARTLAIQQVNAIADQAHHNSANRTCYLARHTNPDLPDDHPENILNTSSNRMLAADLLPENSPLKTLYYWENTVRFIGGIVGQEEIYVSDDPMQPVNALCYQAGDSSAWHFDSHNSFTMTLMLQAPVKGGAFEMVPNIRSDDDPKYADITRALRGQHDGVIEVGRKEGALCIFRGCNSMHRVSTVEGDRKRIMGVFVYEDRPGVIGDPIVNATVYGRPSAAA